MIDDDRMIYEELLRDIEEVLATLERQETGD